MKAMNRGNVNKHHFFKGIIEIMQEGTRGQACGQWTCLALYYTYQLLLILLLIYLQAVDINIVPPSMSLSVTYIGMVV